MRHVIRLMAVICCALALQAGSAQAEKRVALSIGIDAYDNLPANEQLRKAVNDARAVGAALRDLGFETTVEENVPKLAFTRAWQRFLNRLEPGDTAALFFAGHGVEIGGLNYLLPRDVPKVELREDQVLAGASIRFNDLMDNLRDRKVRVALLIVDACRDNPFRDSVGRSVGGTRGLARAEPAEGSFVMYSAGAGEQALDRLPGADSNPNSVYTRALLPILASPGLSLQDIATRVREHVVEVARAAGHKQTPAYYDQLVGKFVLKAGPPGDAKPVGLPGPSEAAEAWAAVKDSTSIAQLEVIAARYKGTVYADLAQARINELKKQQVVVVAPPPASVPPPAKLVEPAVAVSPSRAARPLTPAEERGLRPKDSFRECDDCPEIVVVPAGEFTMGSPASEPERESWKKGTESPQLKVTIARPFAVGRFAVTFDEWDACAAAGGCTHRPGDQGWGRGKRPVIDVNWDEAKAYAAWLSRKTGKTYRLLSEAEREYVARAGTTTPFWWGFSITPRQANYVGTSTYAGGGSKGEYRRRTVPVDSFEPNPWGLYQVHGNVWEWTEDCWNDGHADNPENGSARTAGDCSRHVVRGGSWDNGPQRLRAAHRFGGATDYRSNNIGFRLARTLSP